MKLKKYMLVDLLLLAVIGCIIEALAIFVFNKMLTAAMITTAISLLIMLVATTRWRWKGLIIAPFLALATMISGRFFNSHGLYDTVYNWRLYIATLCSLLSVSINLLWFKKFDYKKTFKSIRLTLGICLVDILVSQLAVSIVYWIITQEFLLLGFLVWNAFAYVILITGSFFLSKQDVLVDIVTNFEEKQNEIKDVDFRMNIEEEDEEKEKGDLKDGESC